MPIQNIKRITPVSSPRPDIDAEGGAYAVHYDDGPEALIVVVYTRADNAHASEDHARATANRHVDENGLPERRIVIVVDSAGKTAVEHLDRDSA